MTQNRMLTLAVLIALAAVFSFSIVTQARQAEAPLVLLFNGDLWTFSPSTGGLTPLTQDGHLSGAWMSPDGAHMAYLASSPVTVDAIQRVGGIGGGGLPADIWIVDIRTGVDTPVAVQPPDASFFVESVQDNAWLRSSPSWSPDGTKIAWAEVHYPSFAQDTNRLMVYDLTTGMTQTILTHLPESSYIPGPQSVRWGGGGLALIAHTFSEQTDGGVSYYTAVMVYDPDGTLLSEVRFQDDADRSELAMDFYWMAQNGRDYVSVRYADDHWQLFDPVTGSLAALVGAPEKFSPLASAASIALVMNIDPDMENDWENRIWAYMDSNRQLVDYLGYHGTGITISPDGQSLAYVEDNQIVVWENGVQRPGVSVTDEIIGAVFWGPTAWRIEPSQAVTCPGALPARLVVGGQAWVIPNTSPNNMRDMPAVSGAVVGQIPPGEPFAVLAGPQCAEGFAWWRVNYAGTIGWTVEGDSEAYWIEPIDYDTYAH